MDDAAMCDRILVVDDEEKLRTILAAILQDAGYEVETAQDGLEAVDKATSFTPHLLIVDLQMPRLNGLETIRRIKEQFPGVIAVILTAHGTIASAVQAIKEGVYDYLTKPFDNDQMLLVVKRALEVYRLSEKVAYLEQALQQQCGRAAMQGNSPVIQQVRAQIQQIADADATVLIRGESGTGKEIAAKAIHYEGRRRNRPLVIVDCTAVSPGLVESEFFGHERGAFTDARERRIGRFEEAHTGTIFLDEIGELPLGIQVKLLRVLQERVFTRVGGNASIHVDVRVIAATNRDLEGQVQEGRFREDLYYRLNVLSLSLPPLRAHLEDLPVYVQHFLAKYRGAVGKPIQGMADGAMQVLESYRWPGNVRELENVMQRAMLRAYGPWISASDLGLLRKPDANAEALLLDASELGSSLRSLVEHAEREIILSTLKEMRGNRTKTAERLKVSRRTLLYKLHQYGPPGSE